MPFYHIHHNLFAENDVIRNGLMGEVIKNQYVLLGRENDLPLVWRLFQEQTFELIRIAEYSHLPSRLKSIFLFESLEDALSFLGRDKRDGENIYEVEICDQTKPIHKASMKLYERIPLERPVLPALEDQARQYWKGINTIDDVFCAELLVESPIRIIKKVETHAAS